MEKIGLAAVLDMTDFNANMSKYDSALETMNKTTADAAGKVGQQFVGLGDAVNKAALVVATAFVAATAAAGAALAKFTSDGIEMAADLEKQMGGIAAVMGKTKDEVGPLNDLIKDLALDPNLKVNTEEAAAAIEMLGRNGLTMDEIMEGAARSTVLLSNATGSDFGMAADIATDVMSIFNIEAKDMNEAVDGITSVVNNSKFSIEDYAGAIAQGGGIAGAVGVSFDDMNTSLAATAYLFASGPDAGTSYKVFLQRLVPDTKDAAEMMRSLGMYTGLTTEEFRDAEEKLAKYEEELEKIDPTSKNAAEKQGELESKIRVLKSSLVEGQNAFFHVDGSMRDMNEIAGVLQGALAGLSEEQQNQALKTLFGTDAMRTAVGLAKVGNDGFLELKATMGNTSAEDAAATRMDNFSGAMEILRGVIEAVQISIGEKFLPVLRTLAERLTVLVTENQPRIEAFFAGVAEWVGEKIPLAMDWLVKTGLPAMGDAFNYLTDTVFPGIAGAIAWATENWDFLSGAIKVLAGVLVTASLVSTFAGIVTAITPLITLITGAGGLVASMTGAGGIAAALVGLLNPIGLVVAAVGGLALAWIALSGDTDESAVAMRESVEREANQMAVVTGETFGAWAESVAGYHRKMKDESGLTLDEMIDNINADFWQMRQDVEASSGKMSQKAIDEMERMRLGAIQQASEMNTGVTAEVSDMATVSAVTSEAFTAQIVSDANKTKDGAVGSMAAMNTAISAELDNLQVSSHLSSSEMKAGILRELDSLRIQHEDGTITWTEGALEKIAWMSVEAQREQLDMRNGVVTESRLLSAEAVAATDGMSADVISKYQQMKVEVSMELTSMHQLSTAHLDATKSTWATGWDTISGRVATVAVTIGENVVSLGRNVQGALNTAMNSALSSWGTAWENVRATISNKASAIATAARSAGSGAVDTLRSGWESGTGSFGMAVQRIAGSISGYFEEKSNHWLTAGRNVIAGVSSGINSGSSGLYAQMQTVAQTAIDRFKSTLGIRSPSEVFAEAGYNISAGLAQGITEGQSLVSEAMARLQGQTQLELNQYSAMVDSQLAATIARYQQGLAQGQAQDSIRQGFDQGQYAAYWAAKQAGESEESAIAKGQAVKKSGTPAATTPAGSGSTTAAAAQAAAAAAAKKAAEFAAWSAGANAAQPWLDKLGISGLQATGQNQISPGSGKSLIEELRDTLVSVSKVIAGAEGMGGIPGLIDMMRNLQALNAPGAGGGMVAALPLEMRLKLSELMDTLGGMQQQQEMAAAAAAAAQAAAPKIGDAAAAQAVGGQLTPLGMGVSATINGVKDFVARTFGIGAGDLTGDLANTQSMVKQKTWGAFQDAGTYGIDVRGLTAANVFNATETLAKISESSSVQAIKDALSKLVDFRNLQDDWTQFQSGGFRQSFGDVTREGNTFNVTFTGNPSDRASVIQDIQFLNSLYGAT